MLHPLMGSDLRTLLTLLVRNGTGRYPIQLSIILAAAFLRWPFSTYERWQVGRTTLPSVQTGGQTGDQTGDRAAPIFIVGHWRSGTTFLHNLLTRSPQFAYISPLATGLPWDFLTLGKLLRPVLERALPKDRFIDRVAVNPDSPQEDEIALASMQMLSYYHGIYFPKHFAKHFNAGIFFEGCDQSEIERWQQTTQYLYKKLQIQNPGKQLLTKNPVYTARVQQLHEMWPNAKFIHIYRNPYVVYQSTLNFYRKLLPELALQPFVHVPIQDIVLQSYPKMMRAVLEDTEKLPKKDFIALQFETFEADPIGQLQRIYAQLELAGWEAAKPFFQDYLDAQKDYQKNQYAFPQESIQQVEAHWRPFISRWGYELPQGREPSLVK